MARIEEKGRGEGSNGFRTLYTDAFCLAKHHSLNTRLVLQTRYNSCGNPWNGSRARFAVAGNLLRHATATYVSEPCRAENHCLDESFYFNMSDTVIGVVLKADAECRCVYSARRYQTWDVQFASFSGSAVTTAWPVLRLRMEVKAFTCRGQLSPH
jgi:hypothetical protein